MSSNKTEIEASEWLARLDGDDICAEQLAEFARWEAADPRNTAAYARLAATWQELGRIQAIRPAADQPIDEDYLAQACQVPSWGLPQPRIDGFAERHSMGLLQARAVLSWPRLLVAAALVLVTLAGFWSLHVFAATRRFHTDIGGFERVVLEDRSIMELNTDSEVRVMFSQNARNVELVRGEAAFAVAHDTAHPFIVTTGSTIVRAVGTKFDVSNFGGSTEVTVAEGVVVIGSPALLRVSAGQTATAGGGGMALKTLPHDGVSRKLAWENQMLVFDGDTLAQVVAQFNRYNSRRMTIPDQKLATLKVSGYFRPTNLDAFLSVLQSDFGIRVDAVGDQLALVRATTS